MSAGDHLSVPGLPVHFRDLDPVREGDLSTYVVHSDLGGSGLEESVLVLESGSSASRAVAVGRDELLYVLSGSGEAVVDEIVHELGPNAAVRIGGGGDYTLRSARGPLEIVAVSGNVQSGAPSGARSSAHAEAQSGSRSARIDALDQAAEEAVSSREFRVLFDPESGCSGMTQFLGYVPAVRTKRHIHPYSEMICIVKGSGTVEIEGHQAAISPGWCYYLPQGAQHRVENTEQDYLVELGVFTPAGSPAQNTPVE